MDIVKDENGKPVLIGQEDPISVPVKHAPSPQMECPVCLGMFDYLVGEDSDGGRLGCETDWRPSKSAMRGGEDYDKTLEIS